MVAAVKYLAAVLIGYLLGCSNMAYFLGRIKRTDLRKKGTGNLGASNTMAVFGWKFGILVAVHDAGKALLAFLLAKLLFPGLVFAPAAAGAAAVLGHLFPFYLHFKGGKGLASFVGLTIGLDIRLALCVAVGLVVITVATDYIALGTVTAAVSVPAYMYFTHGPVFCLIILAASLPILYAHRQNYVRIYNGTEIGLRRAARGDHREQHKP